MSLTSTIDFHPESPAFLADPYPLFVQLRDEDPCHWSPRLNSWVLTRYEDIKAVCQSPLQMSSDRLRPFFASLQGNDASSITNIIRYLSLWMVFRDPPDHTRLRKLSSKVFHNTSIQAQRPQIEQITQYLLQKLGEKEEFDFIAEFAGPLPCLVIMAMLGIPAQDLPLVKRLSDDMALFIGSSRASPAKYATAELATQEMAHYFRSYIIRRRAHPEADLLSELVHLEDDKGDRFSEDELVASCILLLFAGHETTTNHIANGLYSLMRFPDQLDLLRSEPNLAAEAVEELLRYDGPTAAQVRILKGETYTLHNKTLSEGDRVFLMFNAANRDHRAYPNPDRLDIHRNGIVHLAFGFGIHFCLGFPLARLEGQIALPTFLSRYSHIALNTASPEWINSLVFRGMKSLPLRVRIK